MKRAKDHCAHLARPVTQGWELWNIGNGDDPKCGATCSEFGWPVDAVVALPSFTVLALPFWLETSERAELRDMVLLQLESRGLGASEAMEFEILGTERQRTLVVAWVMPSLPDEIADLPMLERCVPAAFTEALPDDACTLWREQGRWTCVVKIRGRVLASQSLGARTTGPALRTEVLCAVAQLLREKIIAEPPREIVVRDVEAEIDAKAWPVPVRQEERPAPVWPDFPGFVPGVFARRKALERRRRTTHRVLTAAGLFVVLMVLGFTVHTTWIWLTFKRLSARIAETEPQVNEIREIAETWNAVAPAIEREQTGLEILYRCARHIPAQGVRFTIFQIKDGTVLLVGEGDNISGVVDLQNKLAKDQELAEFRWKMPPPRILPNNVARFEISGARAGYDPLQE
jgi:hypothetical protein